MSADVTNATYAPSTEFVAQTNVTKAAYDSLYSASVSDPDAFWGEQAKRVDWIKPFTQVKDVSFAPGNVSINWFADGTLNVA
ncbi:acetyl-coenzyme A synthetase, partial [Epibacterium sp. SM1979]